MRRTPSYFSIPLAAGARFQVREVARILTILSITGADTCSFGLDGEEPRTLPENFKVGSRKDPPFDRVEVFNSNAVPILAEFCISTGEAGADNGALTSIAASLANIDADLDELKPYSTHVRIPKTAIAQTGVGFTQLVAANGLNREVEIVCDLANAGYIYLATTDDVTDALSITELAAGGSWNRKWKGNVYACGSAAGMNVRGSIWRE